MKSAVIKNLEQMLAAGKDSALLRFGLGNEYVKAGELQQAITHLCEAVTQDPQYSAAWKLLGKAYELRGQLQQASNVYQRGIDVAKQRGDQQAVKEMDVFIRRIQQQLAST